MAPKIRPQTPKPLNSDFSHQTSSSVKYKITLSYNQVKKYLFSQNHLLPALCLLFFLEIIINVLVIHRVNYTEIDWKAYMQEVEGPLNGTFDYSLLKGDTGPLVYPAGFVWIFTGFYALTGRGENIRIAQYLFLIIYLANLFLVFRIYLRVKKVPPYVLVLTCLTSYRIHSIYVLRLFNDPVAMLFLYAAINAYLDNKWSLGSFLFSLAVSVKMNVLLFAPAILLAYLMILGLKQTIIQLSICATLQIVLALPFLFTSPVSYILGAFDFGRVFLFQWTVNWRFLPETIFVSKFFHLTLLALHLGLLALFYKHEKRALYSYSTLRDVEVMVKEKLGEFLAKNPKIDKDSAENANKSFSMSAAQQLFITPLFVANLIGVACSRSLHYQFYVWYFNTLPYLAWSTNYSVSVRLIILGVIEFAWNTYPSTVISSLMLHACHAALLWGIFNNKIREKIDRSE